MDYLWIIMMFLSALILTAPIHCRVHWWTTDVMLHFSKSVHMKKQTQLHLGMSEGEYVFSKVKLLGKLFLWEQLIFLRKEHKDNKYISSFENSSMIIIPHSWAQTTSVSQSTISNTKVQNAIYAWLYHDYKCMPYQPHGAINLPKNPTEEKK